MFNGRYVLWSNSKSRCKALRATFVGSWRVGQPIVVVLRTSSLCC